MNVYIIEEAAALKLEYGLTLADTLAGSQLLQMAKAYTENESTPKASTPINTFIARKEDMSSNGRIRLIKESDGDICLAIIQEDGTIAGIQFCTNYGGGKSPHTLKALNDLALAIIKDNLESPIKSAEY